MTYHASHNTGPIEVQGNYQRDNVIISGSNAKASRAPKYSEVVKHNSVPQSSLSASEDLVHKIAREAVRIGKILGVTVIQHEKATVKHPKTNEKAAVNRPKVGLKKNRKPLIKGGAHKDTKGSQQ